MAHYVTVGELIEALQQYDPNARVFTMHQPSWPFEYSIEGIAVRRHFEDFDGDAYDEETGEPLQAEERDDYGEFQLDYNHELKSGSDVFLLEGRQLDYGAKSAWDAADQSF